MGSGISSANSRKWQNRNRKRELPPNAESSRVLFLLYLIHRTWNVVVEHVDSKSQRWRGSHTVASSRAQGLDSVSLAGSDAGSSCSGCSCSYCRLRECAHDCVSELTLLEGMAHSGGWSEELVSKEKQRPPIYNPEDYATSLKKWGKKLAGGSLYEPEAAQEKARTLPTQGSKDFRNPCLNMGEEMSLRQFGTPSELLTKLRADLRLSFPSFVQEFACEPLDGVALLLELLRNVQLSQSTDGAKGPPAVRRRPLLDELACLQCIWSCCIRYPDCVRRLVGGAGSTGVYTLTVCIMSTVNKSRVLALQLLTKACYPPANGHSMVSEALSTLRLRYGEPVRFRFLVGMLQSSGGSGDLQTAGLAFINALLASTPTPQRKLYIQAELEQAGFDIITLKKMMSKLPNSNDNVLKEIEYYEKQLIDIDTLSEKAHEAQKEKDDLRHKLELLEKRVKILQEEKGILMSLEKCLKEKCCELQEEVSSLRSEHGNSNRKKSFCMKKKNSVHTSRDESSPPEDEGISSSERSLSPEGDLQRESMVYEVFNVKNETYDLMRNKRTLHKKLDSSKKNDHKKSSDEEEEETTIDEVIQELRNIVNHAESEQYAKERNGYGDDKSSRCNQTSEINVSVKGFECKKHRDIEKEDSVTSTRHSIQITSSTECLNEANDDDGEIEIVPSKILPHPPRKAKSLIHLFVPPVEQGLLYSKPPDLYDDTFYSSDEGSDSLLSASRCNNPVTKKPSGSSFDFKERRAVFSITERKSDDKNKRSRTRSREEYRKSSVKRSESFQTSEKGSRQREYIDSMFHDSQASLFATQPQLQRSNSKGSKVDEIVNLLESKKLTKSLDRIDEGLNSMVDIVMLNEPKKPQWPYERRQRSCSRTDSDTGKETPLVPIARSNSRANGFNQRYDTRSSSQKGKEEPSKDSQKFYLTHKKLSAGSFENSSFNNTFIVKRGHSNAGFYSGPHILRDAPASMTSLVMNGTHSHADLKRTFSPTGSSSFGTHKVTDMPSGLY